jgi:hypothetical protein
MSTLHPTATFEERLLDGLLDVHAELHDGPSILAAPTTLPPRRRRRARVAVGAIAATVVAAAVLTQALPGGVDHATPAAAAELSRLAAKAATLPVVAKPGPGQFQYTESIGVTSMTSVGTSVYSANLRDHRQIWIGSDGSGRIVESQTDPTFPTPEDRANWVAAGRPSLTNGPSDETFAPGQLSVGPSKDLWTLTTNVDELAAQLSSRQIEGGPPGAAEDFVQVGDLLRETAAPPALRAALFQVAARIPGVRLVGTVVTPSGQRGTAIALTGAGPRGLETRHELIFDPVTSALVGEEDVFVDPTTHAETDLTWTSYLASGVVDSAHATT